MNKNTYYLAKMLGNYVLESRKKLGMTQVELSKRLGFSPQFMGRIEKGEVCLPEESIIKAVGILKLSDDKIIKIYRVAGEQGAKALLSKSVALKKRC